VTSPDDERDRIRDLDDLAPVPVADRPAEKPAKSPEPDRGIDDLPGVGEIPTASPPSHTMQGTAEELPPVDGVFAPPGDEPAS
jgi:hypothetical protein